MTAKFDQSDGCEMGHCIDRFNVVVLWYYATSTPLKLDSTRQNISRCFFHGKMKFSNQFPGLNKRESNIKIFARIAFQLG